MKFTDYEASEITPLPTLIEKLNAVLKYLREENHLYLHRFTFISENRRVACLHLSSKKEFTPSELQAYVDTYSSSTDVSKMLSTFFERKYISKPDTNIIVDELITDYISGEYGFSIRRLQNGSGGYSNEKVLEVAQELIEEIL